MAKASHNTHFILIGYTLHEVAASAQQLTRFIYIYLMSSSLTQRVTAFQAKQNRIPNKQQENSVVKGEKCLVGRFEIQNRRMKNDILLL